MAVPVEWSEVDRALVRAFRFEGFPQAIAFVDRLAELAESEDHHPDIEIHYTTVTAHWRTHTAGGVTDRDRELAGKTDGLV